MSDSSTQPRSRRQLLAAAGKLSAVMATLGLTASSVLAPREASASTPSDPATVDALRGLINMAIETGDMNAAVDEYAEAAGLSDDVVQQLLQIDAEDLAAISDIADELQTVLDAPLQVRCEIIEHVSTKSEA